MEIDALPPTRQQILLFLKHQGPSTSAEIARRLEVTAEAVRQHLLAMEEEGWVRRRRDGGAPGPGRPAFRYELTPAGEHLFPKGYDALALELIDTVADRLGGDALREVLASLTETRVRRWEARLRGRPLRERVALLREVYMADDPFMEVEEDAGGLRLVEYNCPFYNVAQRRPALCSVTVCALSRLLGVRVVREERFQDGHGRCVFRLLPDEPVESDAPFAPEV